MAFVGGYVILSDLGGRPPGLGSFALCCALMGVPTRFEDGPEDAPAATCVLMGVPTHLGDGPEGMQGARGSSQGGELPLCGVANPRRPCVCGKKKKATSTRG